jgi:hypothetical protein
MGGRLCAEMAGRDEGVTREEAGGVNVGFSGGGISSVVSQRGIGG